MAELCWIFSTVVPVSWLERNPTYKEGLADGKENSNGLLTYPVLQAADIVIYKASKVPVGKDQAPHLELSREIVRAFNRRYGPIFPEPNAVFTDAPIVLGTDGVKKMGKSAGNTIPIFAEPDQVRALLGSPDEVANETTASGGSREIWTYRSVGKSVVFENGVVAAVR